MVIPFITPLSEIMTNFLNNVDILRYLLNRRIAEFKKKLKIS
jgi:hypothetical protein